MKYARLCRGKRIDNGEWVKSGTVVRVTADNMDDETFIPARSDKFVCLQDEDGTIVQMDNVRLFRIDPKSFGWNIGIQDKNGEEIFDGDIVRHYNDTRNPDHYDEGLIFWDNERLCFRRTSSPENVMVWSDCCYEIIGNIHDNPELISKGGIE